MTQAPNNNRLTRLESDLLNWISERTNDPALRAQIVDAVVKRRDYIRTGFFVYMQASHDGPPVEAGLSIRQPLITSPELPDGAGCTLFMKDGYLHYLEIYARGAFFPEQLSNYELDDDE